MVPEITASKSLFCWLAMASWIPGRGDGGRQGRCFAATLQLLFPEKIVRSQMTSGCFCQTLNPVACTLRTFGYIVAEKGQGYRRRAVSSVDEEYSTSSSEKKYHPNEGPHFMLGERPPMTSKLGPKIGRLATIPS